MTYSSEKIHEDADEYFNRTGRIHYQFWLPHDPVAFIDHEVSPHHDMVHDVHTLVAQTYKVSKDGEPVICSICQRPVTAITARPDPTIAKLIALHRRACRERHPIEEPKFCPVDTRPPPENLNIKGIDKARILVALYKGARPQGMGFFHDWRKPLTIKEARKLLGEQKRFDYLNGRVMKVDLRGDELFTAGYDRDNGHGAARAALIDEGIMV